MKEKKQRRNQSRNLLINNKISLIGEELPVKFEFNKGVLQTDGNGKYILMDGEKYYAEEYYEDNDQKRDLKYFYVTTNTTAGVKIQF